MLCRTTKEEATQLNTIAGQLQTLMTAQIVATSAVVAGSAPVSPCLKTSAVVQAIMNHLMIALLQHRHSHGQWEEVDSLKILRDRPEVFEALVRDANEIFAACLRGVDPAHDYLLDLFKTEKAAPPAAGELK